MNYIKGTYTKEIYANQENGYVVGVMKLKDTDLEITNTTIYFTGTFYNLRYKSNYTMYGEYTNHPKYGTQFHVTSYELLLPTKEEELIEFLSSDLFPIGEKTATKIVEVFKENTLDIILNEPNRLTCIPHLPKARIEKIYKVLTDYQYSSKIVIELTTLGFSNKNALAIVNKYKMKAMDKINENIYSLIEEMDFNFMDIDSIALNSGLEENDDRRVQALIIYVMNESTFESGNTYMSYEEILHTILKYNHNINDEILEYNIFKLNEQQKIKIIEDKYYLKALYEAERYIADKLCFLNDITKTKPPKLTEKIKELEEKNGIFYDKIQKKAIKKAITNNVTIITGGPGTGKTTIIKAIVYLFKELYKAKEEEIALLAPTGRAAKKMMETTNLKSYTIHRYLGWDKEGNKFSVNEYNPNKEKYIIVDEVSMLDTILMSALLKGIRRDVRLVLVGDYYQLPSVGQGQVLKDLIDSDMIDIVKLNCLYRQNEDSYIPILASEIKDKDLSESFMNKKDDYNFIISENTKVIPTILYIVESAIKKGYTDKEIQILAPMYKSINGIDMLNKYLQKLFNPPSKNKNELILTDVIYRVGDKVLQLVNDTESNVYNGDLGYITDIIDGKKSISKKTEIIVDYDGNKVTYPPDKYMNIRHGYAISIHKAQGSEFPMVIMPIVNNFNRMLYNKLIYTGVTRAKNSLILVGDPTCFINGIKNDFVDYRKTTLKEFILEKYNYNKIYK
ncbi:MAG: ATP-dependent RecD-like DNA helicase [Erysipelotrichaceae bacterium]|nr:ATP-dependent RecD-like DNA helicase [Erysipelotrichaceae bacterium]